MNKPVPQSTFQIEKLFPQPKERVFAALQDPTKKRRWFAEGDGFELQSYELDFRVGGFERTFFRPKGGPPMTQEAYYFDIIPNERIVFAYSMTIAGAPLSASLGTMELSSTELDSGKLGTRLLYTEHTAYLDGNDGSVSRREGTEQLFVALARELELHT